MGTELGLFTARSCTQRALLVYARALRAPREARHLAQNAVLDLAEWTEGRTTAMRNPRVDPREGDVLNRWDRNFTVTRVTQGCVYTEPALSTNQWLGILFFREWAQRAAVVHVAEEVTK